jgi:hypothetical protein
MTVALLVHADRRNAEAEEAGVVVSELRFDRRKIEEIVMHDFAQLGMLLSGRAAPDRKHAFNAGIEQALAQHALPDHAGGAEQDDFHPWVNSVHRLINASRSALIVAASVVGMPCGKPL